MNGQKNDGNQKHQSRPSNYCSKKHLITRETNIIDQTNTPINMQI